MLAATVMVLSAVATGQQHPMAPRGQFLPREMDSGWIAHAGGPAADEAAFAHVVHTAGALWTRLYFAEIALEGASSIRLTSLLDGEVQHLTADTAREWGNTSAYFNGDTVLIELVTAPGTEKNRFLLERIAVEIAGEPISNHCTPPLCGICGFDDREPSEENWAGRLLPPGCSASIYNDESCVVTAGHCVASNSIMQFNVPDSTPFCETQNPPVADQFPVVEQIFENSGPGADWAVMLLGTNNLGQTAFERYGEFRPLALDVPTSGPVDVWGYGISETCIVTQTQQHSTGFINSVSSNVINHSADTTCGNSGSAILQNNEIIGVITHCGCPGGNNRATRIDTPPFHDAIAALCPPSPENNSCQDRIVVTDGETEFHNLFATTAGPDEPTLCTLLGSSTIQRDVWYEYTATCDGQVTISVCNSNFPTKLGVYASDSCPTESNTITACDLFSCPASTLSEIVMPASQGEPFIIRVGGRVDHEGSGVLSVFCNEVFPCPGDLTGDAMTDVSDLLVLLGMWGNCDIPGACDADLTGDHQVNVGDLLELLSEWGSCP